MKLNLIIIFLFIFSFNSCGQDLFSVKSELIGSYDLKNNQFYLNILKISSGATDPDIMQIRRVYNDSTYEIVKNIENVDSIVKFNCIRDSATLIVRGKLWDEYVQDEIHEFSVNYTLISGRRKNNDTPTSKQK
jgi:hypothetical protein